MCAHLVRPHAQTPPRMRLFGRGRVAEERLWLPNWASDRIVAEAEESVPDETGGALMGYETDDGLVITDLIGAGPNAVRMPSRFTPDAEHQWSEIAKLYERSGRLHAYIGDWHSHPNGSPRYSVVDRAALRVLARSPESRCERPVMLILGGGDHSETIAWRYQPRRWWDRVVAMQIHRF